MNIRLWKPSIRAKKNSNLFKFEKFISKRFNKNFNQNFKRIHDWSVKNQGDFWSSVWDYSKVKGNKSKDNSKTSSKFYRNIFLPNSKLNFAENLDRLNKRIIYPIAILFLIVFGYLNLKRKE